MKNIQKFYFLNKTDEGIERYNITYDVNELERIKSEINNNCVAFVHKIEEGYVEPSTNGQKYDLEFEKIGEGGGLITHTTRHDIFRFEWNQYELPKIYFLVKSLLESTNTVIKANSAMEILLYEEETLDEKVMKAKLELDESSSNDLEDLEEKLKKYKLLLYLKEKNKDVKPIGPYIEKIKQMIQIEMVDFIPIEEYEKFQKVFGKEINSDYGNWGSNLSNEYISTLKRTLKKTQ